MFEWFQVPQGRQFEEEPAVPQPAYVFTEYPFGLEDAPATFQVPPVYSEEDPVKRDEPPPPYLNDDDTGVLIENQENWHLKRTFGRVCIYKVTHLLILSLVR